MPSSCFACGRSCGPTSLHPGYVPAVLLSHPLPRLLLWLPSHLQMPVAAAPAAAPVATSPHCPSGQAAHSAMPAHCRCLNHGGLELVGGVVKVGWQDALPLQPGGPWPSLALHSPPTSPFQLISSSKRLISSCCTQDAERKVLQTTSTEVDIGSSGCPSCGNYQCHSRMTDKEEEWFLARPGPWV